MESPKEYLIDQFKNWCNSPFSIEARKYHYEHAWQLDVLDTCTYPWNSRFELGQSYKDVVIANGGFDLIRVVKSNVGGIIILLSGDHNDIELTPEEYAECYTLFVKGCNGLIRKTAQP